MTVPTAPSASLPAFAPRGLFRSGHVQTMLGNLPPRRWPVLARARALRAAAQEWLLDCGEGVTLQAFYSPAVGATRTALVLHGWEGSAESTYVLSLSAHLYAQGWSVVRLNLRDHGITHHLNREIFHSCRLPEVVGAIRAISARLGDVRLHMAGFSLGGNFLLRAAADPGVPAVLAGVVAVSPVLDPATTLAALERGWLYQRYFVQRWSRSLKYKERAWPDGEDFAVVRRYADLRRMTAALVKRCTPFPHIDAYLEGYAITGDRLATLQCPAHILSAVDDPMIPTEDLVRLAATPYLQVTAPAHGGHCGFADAWSGASWADRATQALFERWR